MAQYPSEFEPLNLADLLQDVGQTRRQRRLIRDDDDEFDEQWLEGLDEAELDEEIAGVGEGNVASPLASQSPRSPKSPKSPRNRSAGNAATRQTSSPPVNARAAPANPRPRANRRPRSPAVNQPAQAGERNNRTTRRGKPSKLNVMGPSPGESMLNLSRTSVWKPETVYSVGDVVTTRSVVYSCVQGGKSGDEEPQLTQGDVLDGEPVGGVRWAALRLLKDLGNRDPDPCSGADYSQYAILSLLERSKKRLDKALQMASAARGMYRRSSLEKNQRSKAEANWKRAKSMECRAMIHNGLSVPVQFQRSAAWELYEGYRLMRVFEVYPSAPVAIARSTVLGRRVLVEGVHIPTTGPDAGDLCWYERNGAGLREKKRASVMEEGDGWKDYVLVANPVRVEEEGVYASIVGTTRLRRYVDGGFWEDNRLHLGLVANAIWHKCGQRNPHWWYNPSQRVGDDVPAIYDPVNEQQSELAYGNLNSLLNGVDPSNIVDEYGNVVGNPQSSATPFSAALTSLNFLLPADGPLPQWTAVDQATMDSYGSFWSDLVNGYHQTVVPSPGPHDEEEEKRHMDCRVLQDEELTDQKTLARVAGLPFAWDAQQTAGARNLAAYARKKAAASRFIWKLFGGTHPGSSIVTSAASDAQQDEIAVEVARSLLPPPYLAYSVGDRERPYLPYNTTTTNNSRFWPAFAPVPPLLLDADAFSFNEVYTFRPFTQEEWFEELPEDGKTYNPNNPNNPVHNDVRNAIRFLNTGRDARGPSFAKLLQIEPLKKPCGVEVAIGPILVGESAMEDDQEIAGAALLVKSTGRGDEEDALPQSRPRIKTPAGSAAATYWKIYREEMLKRSREVLDGNDKRFWADCCTVDRQRPTPFLQNVIARQFRYGMYARMLQHAMMHRLEISKEAADSAGVPYEQSMPVSDWLAEKLGAPFDEVQQLELAFRLGKLPRRLLMDEDNRPILNEAGDETWSVEWASRHGQNIEDRGGDILIANLDRSTEAAYPRTEGVVSVEQDPNVQLPEGAQATRMLYSVPYLLLPTEESPGNTPLTLYVGAALNAELDVSLVATLNRDRPPLDGLFGLARIVQNPDGSISEIKFPSAEYDEWLRGATEKDLVYRNYRLVNTNFKSPYCGLVTYGLDFADHGDGV